jgi:hypothetical protein
VIVKNQTWIIFQNKKGIGSGAGKFLHVTDRVGNSQIKVTGLFGSGNLARPAEF